MKRYKRLFEDRIDIAYGDPDGDPSGNLIVSLHIDTDDKGDFWKVVVASKGYKEIFERKKFRDEQEARNYFEKVKKEF